MSVVAVLVVVVAIAIVAVFRCLCFCLHLCAKFVRLSPSILLLTYFVLELVPLSEFRFVAEIHIDS